MQILYQDKHMLVVNKPSNLLSQPGSLDDSVVHRLEKKFPFIGQVHRLDRLTSGIMVFGLTKKAQSKLSIQFQDRKTFKVYEAIVFGSLPNSKGHIDLPLRCDWPNRPIQEVHEEGRQSLTHWEFVESFQDTDKQHTYSRVLLIPHTGRSHQLRVHMSAIGFPIIGDFFYAHKTALDAADRLNLHARSLHLNHPVTGNRMHFESKAPF
jgi:tRNA pseudouridine32 synthase/23S rRNA pseudouridine746 synthase